MNIRNIVLVLFLLTSLSGFSQRTKDSVVYLRYDEPRVYLEKAGNLGMGAIGVQAASILIYAGVYKDPNFKDAWKIVAAGSILSSYMTVLAFKHIKNAGLSMYERDRMKLTLKTSGINLCYRF